MDRFTSVITTLASFDIVGFPTLAMNSKGYGLACMMYDDVSFFQTSTY
jgi:hypothetical protein